MAFHLEWEIEGDKQLSRRLRTLEKWPKDLTGPFRTASTNLKKIFEAEVFDTRGRVIGEQWKRLSPATVARKARSGYPSDPLIATGAMKGSFRTIVTSDSAVIGNTAEYFKYHQSNKPRAKLPRRVMMKIGNNQKTMVVRVFQEHLRKFIVK